MTQQPWVVALISTDYDLKDERSAIIKLLHNKGIEVSAFEEPSFPVIESEYSQQNCLDALKRADIAILIIKERYGGKYYLNQEVSITQTEYSSLSIPTIVLVNQKTWEERASYRRQQKISGLSEDEYAATSKYDSGSIDINTIRFIDSIQKAYQEKGRSNWINFWNNVEDLQNNLENVLGSRSITIIHEIVEAQVKEVKNRRTSTGLSMPLGDVFDKNYYIEPEYIVQAGTVDDSETLSIEINKELSKGCSCLILGEAGAGKTTLMARCFLSMANSLNSNPFVIPVYVRLKSMSPQNAFTVEEYLKVSCGQYLHKQCFPFFHLEGFRFVFFLDGFDELSENLSKDELKQIYESEMFKGPILLTSRMQCADRYFNSNDFASKFGCLIKLTDWTEDNAIKYINRFCELQKKDKKFEERINTLLVKNADLHDILKTPLLITILLYVIDRSRMEIPETIRSRTQLFEECFDRLAQREIESKLAGRGNTPGNVDLVVHWAYFAWMIYENKLKGENRVRISDATSRIERVFNGVNNQWPSVVYEVIFDTDGEYAYGAFHEQFLEFLVAYTLAYACLNKIEPYPNFLKYVMRPEINRYFRGIVARKSESEQQIIINRIKELYWDCVGKNTENDIMKRVHAVYHLSRMMSSKDDEEIDRIFNSEKEIVVLQSLYFGVIKKGNLSRERELFDLLNSNDDYSNSNRGYHLAYYDSISSQIPLSYTDDESIDWEGPLRAFQRHFASLDTEHYYLRRIDLVTMRQFMEFRKKRAPLNDERLNEFENWIKTTPRGADSGYQKLVEAEFERLKETYDKFNVLD